MQNSNWNESKMQAELFRLIRIRAKTSDKCAVIYSIPNGGLRDRTTAQKMYAEGVRAGVWDICVPVQTPEYSMMFLEMKFGKNKLTPAQIDFQEKMNAVSVKPVMWAVCYDYRTAYETIENYLNGVTPKGGLK
jgi:hypothetical protein